MKTKRTAFTLVELLVSTAVISIIILMMVTVAGQASDIWRNSASKIEQFREARNAFESMTTRLAQATLNTYWAYNNPTSPTRYERRSDLRFISGPAETLLGGAGTHPTHAVFFQAPLGLTDTAAFQSFGNTLNTLGYFLEYGSDAAQRPQFIREEIVPLRHRYRLMELRQPAEANGIYHHTAPAGKTGTVVSSYAGKEWFRDPVGKGTGRPVRVLAENVIALIITPRLAEADENDVKKGGSGAADESPLAPDYLYDSSPSTGADARRANPRLNPLHQLPPVLQVTMVAIAESSAGRLPFQKGWKDHFETKDKFVKSRDYSKDLLTTGDANSLENLLSERRISYRLFSTNVVIRGAKWSTEQTE
jgi:uncharacterized protein (TIGR02599 family)